METLRFNTLANPNIAYKDILIRAYKKNRFKLKIEFAPGSLHSKFMPSSFGLSGYFYGNLNSFKHKNTFQNICDELMHSASNVSKELFNNPHRQQLSLIVENTYRKKSVIFPGSSIPVEFLLVAGYDISTILKNYTIRQFYTAHTQTLFLSHYLGPNSALTRSPKDTYGSFFRNHYIRNFYIGTYLYHIDQYILDNYLNDLDVFHTGIYYRGNLPRKGRIGNLYLNFLYHHKPIPRDLHVDHIEFILDSKLSLQEQLDILLAEKKASNNYKIQVSKYENMIPIIKVNLW
jgi:hypothetical protein